MKRIHADSYLSILNRIDSFISLNDSVEYISVKNSKKIFNVKEVEDIELAAYKDDDKLIVVGLNRGKTSKSLMIEVPELWHGSQVKLISVIDSETNSPIKFQNNRWKMTIRAKDFSVNFLKLNLHQKEVF